AEGRRRFLQLKEQISDEQCRHKQQAVVKDVAGPDKISWMSVSEEQVEQQPAKGLYQRERYSHCHQRVKSERSQHSVPLAGSQTRAYFCVYRLLNFHFCLVLFRVRRRPAYKFFQAGF